MVCMQTKKHIIDGQGGILIDTPVGVAEKEREVLIESQRHLLPACVANKTGGSPSARQMVGEEEPSQRVAHRNAKTSCNTKYQHAILSMRESARVWGIFVKR